MLIRNFHILFLGIHQGVSEFNVADRTPLRNAGIVAVPTAVEPPID